MNNELKSTYEYICTDEPKYYNHLLKDSSGAKILIGCSLTIAYYAAQMLD